MDPGLLSSLIAAVQSGKLPESDLWTAMRRAGLIDSEKTDEMIREEVASQPYAGVSNPSVKLTSINETSEYRITAIPELEVGDSLVLMAVYGGTAVISDPVLSMAAEIDGTAVNLAADAPVAWMKMGYNWTLGAPGVNGSSGDTTDISVGTYPTGNALTYYNNDPRAVTPANFGTGQDGVFFNGTGVGTGMKITLPADNILRVAKIYFGAYDASGVSIVAHLTSSAVSDVNDTASVFSAANTLANGVATITYAGEETGDALEVTITVTTDAGGPYLPNIGVQAVQIFAGVTPELSDVSLKSDASFDADEKVTGFAVAVFDPDTNTIGASAIQTLVTIGYSTRSTLLASKQRSNDTEEKALEKQGVKVTPQVSEAMTRRDQAKDTSVVASLQQELSVLRMGTAERQRDTASRMLSASATSAQVTEVEKLLRQSDRAQLFNEQLASYKQQFDQFSADYVRLPHRLRPPPVPPVRQLAMHWPTHLL